MFRILNIFFRDRKCSLLQKYKRVKQLNFFFKRNRNGYLCDLCHNIWPIVSSIRIYRHNFFTITLCNFIFTAILYKFDLSQANFIINGNKRYLDFLWISKLNKCGLFSCWMTILKISNQNILNNFRRIWNNGKKI